MGVREAGPLFTRGLTLQSLYCLSPCTPPVQCARPSALVAEGRVPSRNDFWISCSVPPTSVDIDASGLVVLACGHPRDRLGVRMLVRLGAREVCYRSENRHWMHDLIDSVGRVFHSHVAQRLVGILAPPGSPFEQGRLACFLGDALRPGATSRHLAATVGWSRRHLARIARKVGLPFPRVIVVFDRLLAAAHLLDATNLPIERIAIDAGFSSGTSLSNATHRYIGSTPSRLRSDGATTTVLSALDQLCWGVACDDRYGSRGGAASVGFFPAGRRWAAREAAYKEASSGS